ncbi:MAG: sensor histidine kinase [Longimicrobiales bacterium]
MNRRYWPAALAFIAIAIFGSYLIYTQHLVRQIEREAAIQREMYGLIQRGLLATEPGGGGEQAALFELQRRMIDLGVPIIVLDPAGRPSAYENLPFDVDPADPALDRRLLGYAARLAQENAPVVVPGAGEIYFGSPPILRGLRWIPWLQVSGGVVALLIAFGLVWSNVRAERERLWAAMARELAHQMGTPLSSMSGWLEVLRLPHDERAELGDDADIAHELGADLERLERVSRRFELIGKRPRMERVELASLLSELERYLRPRLPRLGAGVRLGVRARSGVPPVTANRVLLLWALENLVKNALDALAGRGGRIRVLATAGPNGDPRLLVADNGPGIPGAIRARLFEPGTTTKSAGWGVGLSLARRIIENLHGGRIAVRARQGGGTVFVIDLPHSERRRYWFRRP